MISVCMIVKNEEEILERCVNSLKGLYDELIIVDTGSTDRTVEIAKKLGAKVERFEWCDDFSAARNHSFSKASGDWLVWVDADDVLTPGDAEKLRRSIIKADEQGLSGLKVKYCLEGDFEYYRLRAVKKSEGPLWKGRIHEDILFKGLTANEESVVFHHKPKNRGLRNTERNLRILEKVISEGAAEPRPMFYYAKELTYVGRLEEAINWFNNYLKVAYWKPEQQRAYYELANCYYRLGRVGLAKKACFNALSLDEDYVDPYVLLMIIAYNEQSWDRVVKWGSACINSREQPDVLFDERSHRSSKPNDYLSIAYYHLGMVDKALEAVNNALSFNPIDERLLANKKLFEEKVRL